MRVAAAGFTNLSRDHLDYHPSVEAYLAAKLRLFEDLVVDGGSAVIDVDHEHSDAVVAAAKKRGLKLITVGRKGATYLRRDFGSRFVEEVSYAQVKRLSFEQADAVAAKVTAMLEAGEFDVCSLIYNRFHSVISQIPETRTSPGRHQ